MQKQIFQRLWLFSRWPVWPCKVFVFFKTSINHKIWSIDILLITLFIFVSHFFLITQFIQYCHLFKWTLFAAFERADSNDNTIFGASLCFCIIIIVLNMHYILSRKEGKHVCVCLLHSQQVNIRNMFGVTCTLESAI